MARVAEKRKAPGKGQDAAPSPFRRSDRTGRGRLGYMLVLVSTTTFLCIIV